MERLTDFFNRKKHLLFNVKTIISLSTVGVLLLLIGAILIFAESSNSKFEKVEPNSWRTKCWTESKFDRFRSVYLFNWTNHDRYLKNESILPVFTEIGPFVFRQQYQVIDLQFFKNSSVAFREKKTWNFRSRLSVGNLTTNVTNLHFPSLVVAEWFESEKNALTKRIVDFWLNKETLISTKSAKALIFEGYRDLMAQSINGANLTKKLPTEYFGWFYGKNGSADGDLLVSPDVGVLSWNGCTHTNYGGNCGFVKGGLTELISSFDGSNKLFVFETDFCSGLLYKYESKTSVQGLNGFKYKGAFFTENYCDGEGKCPVGYVNVTWCKNDLPVFVSHPLFNGSAIVDSGDKENYIVIEKETGLPVKIHKTYQFNVLLRRYPWQRFQNVKKELFVPVLWYRDEWKIDSDFGTKLKDELELPIKMKSYRTAAFFFAFLFSSLAALSFWTNWKRRKEGFDAAHLLDNE